ncbi:hypothetical protein FRC07_001662 [Ceratobasidium sp. 392]|nr:hypothetical protein FRC07_001662 [Ceratobasidium sp. 392]
MPKYNSRMRKGRSASQKSQTKKAQAQALAQRSSEEITPALDSMSYQVHPQPYHSTSPDVSLRLNARSFQRLKLKYKNALEREKRAKTKVHALQTSADLEHEKLADALRVQANTETELNDARGLTNAYAQNVEVLREYVNRLENQVEQYSRDIATIQEQLETQYKMSYIVLETRCVKKVERIKSQKAKAKAALNVSDSVIQTYQLKDKAEHISDVIKVVAEGLGIQIEGSVSARSVARVMLEGLIQARMQVGHELNQANLSVVMGQL